LPSLWAATSSQIAGIRDEGAELTPNHYGLESAMPDFQSVFKKPGGGIAEL